MSYPISGLNTTYRHKGYDVGHKIVPHGISVAVTSPAVFEFTASASPDRHLEVAAIFGADVTNAKAADAGRILSEALRGFLHTLDVPNGITAFGFSRDHLPALVDGTLPQHRVTKLAPNPASRDALEALFERSLRIY
ncbi:Hydroxyacid-oxoacid transhydrogenase, mitochondrial [Cladochytrium tenue]|nr:Hydroxyacid-oxoacid transhydrogenase, mitochondrial [Cladochytrium tenue]